MSDVRHAGVGFPNGHVGVGRVFALPSNDLLMLSSEGRWHLDKATQAGKRVIWRAVAEPGQRPAEVGYSPARYVRAIVNHLDEQEDRPAGFIGWNEPDLNYERGDGSDDFSNLASRYQLLGQFHLHVLAGIRDVLPSGVDLHYGAWTPDHYALDHIAAWREAAESADVIDVHAYGATEQILGALSAYRSAFPTKRLALTEWHASGDLDSERRTLAALADLAERDPLFDGAFFFIWRWWQPADWWSDSFDLEHNPDRLALFMDPPVAALPAPDAPPIPDPELPAPVPVPPAVPDPAPEPAMPNPYEHFTAEQIAGVSECPIAAVREHWPRIVGQLDACGINDRATQLATIGTVAIETASTFEPVREAYWLDEEWRRANLRYFPFYGRGYVQLTWASNYAAYSAAINELWGAGDAVDLIARPDDALDPDIAAAALALYFRDHGGAGLCLIPKAARRGDWREVRRLVQGGSDGLDRLVAIASALGEEQVVPNPVPEPEPVPTIVYDADAQTQLQLQSWTCSIRSAMWCLSSLGVYLTPADAQNDMIGHGEVTSTSGLSDARGYGLAAFLGRHLPSGLTPEVLEAPTWQDIRDRAGRGPIALGGRGWNHWSAVRNSLEDDSLELANPAPGWMGVGQRLHAADWSRLGPWSAVFVEVAPAEIPGQEVDELSAAERAELDDLRQKTPGLIIALADVADRIGDQLAAASVPKAKRLKLVKEMRGIRAQFLGERPA